MSKQDETKDPKSLALEQRNPSAGAIVQPRPDQMDRTDGSDVEPKPRTKPVKGFKKYRVGREDHYRMGTIYPAGSVVEIPTDEPPGSGWSEVGGDTPIGLEVTDVNPNPMPPSPAMAKDIHTLRGYAPTPTGKETPVDKGHVAKMKRDHRVQALGEEEVSRQERAREQAALLDNRKT